MNVMLSEATDSCFPASGYQKYQYGTM